MFCQFILKLFGNFSCLILSVSSAQKFPPPLSGSEEADLFRKMHENEDKIARNTLIEHNLRLVAHIVRKYYASQNCTDDLLSIGTIGLIKAIDSFNSQNGARFATYAAKCIQNAIHAVSRVTEGKIDAICPISVKNSGCSSEPHAASFPFAQKRFYGNTTTN